MHAETLIPVLLVVLLVGLISLAYAVVTTPELEDEDDDPVGIDWVPHPYSSQEWHRHDLP